MTPDEIAAVLESFWPSDQVGTHWGGCWQAHPGCFAHALAAEVEKLSRSQTLCEEALKIAHHRAEPRCTCGYLGWTVDKFGRETHKEKCPRINPWYPQREARP